MTQTQLLQVTRSIFVNTNIALGTHDVKIKPQGKNIDAKSVFHGPSTPRTPTKHR